MLHPITQRIEDFWSAKKFKSRRAFAKQLRGVTLNQYFSKHRKTGKFMTPSTDTVYAIAEAFPDINLTWLLLGKGPMLLPENSHPMAQNVDYLGMLDRALYQAEELEKKMTELRNQLAKLKSLTTDREDVTHGRQGKGRSGDEAADGSEYSARSGKNRKI